MKAVFGPYTVAIGKSLAPSRALIAERYWRKGYTPTHILTSHGAVIDVLLDGNVVGTVLVTLDSPRGLSADDAYSAECDSIRGEGRKLAELSRFAILPGQTTRSVMAAMFHFVYYYTYLLNDVTDLVCEVIPVMLPPRNAFWVFSKLPDRGAVTAWGQKRLYCCIGRWNGCNTVISAQTNAA